MQNKQSSQSEDIRKFIDSEIALSQQRSQEGEEQGLHQSEKSSSSEEEEEQKLIELIQAEFDQDDETPSDSEKEDGSDENKERTAQKEVSIQDSQEGERSEQEQEEMKSEENENEEEGEEQDEEEDEEEEDKYLLPRRELPQRSNRGAKMQHLIQNGFEEEDQHLWKDLVGSDFTEKQDGESKSFDEEASSVRQSERHDSEDSDIDLTQSEGEYSEDESESQKKRKSNLVRPRKKINFQEIEQLLEYEEAKEQQGEQEEEEKEIRNVLKEQEKLTQEWEKVKSSKAEAKIRKELRNLRPHRQFNFKDMVDFSPSQLKIDSSTARQTRGAEMRGKSKSSKSHSKNSKDKSKKVKPKPPPTFIMPSQEEMLRQCAYNELVNSQLANTGGCEEYHYIVGQKKYLEKRTRHTKDWSKMDQGFNMKQLLKECRITKVQRVGTDGRLKHYVKVRTPLDSLRFEEGQEILTTADVLFPERHEKLKREHRKRDRMQQLKQAKYRDPVTNSQYSTSGEYLQLQKNVMAKEDDQLMSLYVSVNEFLSMNK